MKVLGCYQFRLTRNSDLFVDEEEVKDLRTALRGELPRHIVNEDVIPRWLERFGGKAADVEGSGNVLGLKDPAVDALLDKAVSATSRPELVASLRALDRVLRHGHYVVPHWYGAVHRVSWRAAAFDRPANLPRYYQPEALVTSVWWSRSAKSAQAVPTVAKKGP